MIYKTVVLNQNWEGKPDEIKKSIDAAINNAAQGGWIFDGSIQLTVTTGCLAKTTTVNNVLIFKKEDQCVGKQSTEMFIQSLFSALLTIR